MKLTIDGWKKIDKVTYDFPDRKTTLIVGDNAEGKSSALEALQFITSLPSGNKPTDLTKDELKELSHNSCEKISVKLETAKGKRTWSYPECDIKGLDGSAGVIISNYSAGVQSLARLDDEPFAERLTGFMKADASPARVREELEEIEKEGRKLSPSIIGDIIDTIFGTDRQSPKGWAAGWDIAKAAGLVEKRKWQELTGRARWGADVGANFAPTGYSTAIGKKTLEELTEDVRTAKEKVERAIAANALSEQEHGNLKAKAESVEKCSADIEHWTAVEAEVNEELEGANTQELVRCGSCDIRGIIVDDVLTALSNEDLATYVPLTPEQIKALKDRLSNAHMAHKLATKTLEEAQAAAKKLESTPEYVDSGIQPAREALLKAESALKMFNQRESAMEMHYQIMCINEAMDILSGSGLRRRLLVNSLPDANVLLANICAAAGIPPVIIDNNFAIRFKGVRYKFLSGAHKYMVDIVTTIFAAIKSGDNLIIFDELDKLGRAFRNAAIKLFIYANNQGITVVAAMTLLANKQGEFDVPDLKSAGIGVTYWAKESTAAIYEEPAVANA